MSRWTIAAALLTACAGAHAAAPETSETPAAPAEPGYRFAPGAFEVGSRSVLRGALNRALGDAHQVFGPWRVEVRPDGRALVAAQPFFSAIADARRCGDGWVFITWHGTIAHAASFAGEARAIGRVPPRDTGTGRTLRAHDGAVTWVEDGLAMHGPCEGPLQRVEPVPGERVRDVARVGDRLVALGGGYDVYASDDAGASWRRLDPGGPPRSLTPDGRVEVGDAWRRVGPDGQLADAPEPTYEERHGDEPRADDERIPDARELAERALFSSRPAARAALDATHVRDGEGGHLELDGQAVVRFYEGERTSIPLAEAGTCRMRRFGPRGAAVCDDGRVLVYRSGRMVPIERPSDTPYFARFSDDGRHLVLEGPCSGAPDDTERQRCLLDVDGTSTPFELPEGASVVAIQGPRLVLVSGHRDTRRVTVLTPGAPESAGWAAPGDDSLHSWQRLDSGAVVATSTPRAADDPTPTLRVFEAGSVHSRPLPDGAQHVVRGPSGRLIAVGRTTAQLWTSDDVARTWEPLSTPFSREHPLSPLLGREGIRLHCDPDGCAIGRFRVTRAAPDEPPVPVVEPLALALEPAQPTLREHPFRVSCETTGPPSASPWGSVEAARTVRSLDVAHTQSAVGTRVEVQRRGTRTRVVWTVPDADRTTVARSDWFDPDAVFGSSSAAPTCSPRRAVAESLLLACELQPEADASDGGDDDYAGGFDEPETRFVIVAAGGGARVAQDEDFQAEFAVARRLGGRWVFMHTVGGVEVRAFDDEAQVVFRRSLRAPADHTAYEYALADLNGVAGLYRQGPPAPGFRSGHVRTLAPLGDVVPVTLPPQDRALEACADGASGARVWRQAEQAQRIMHDGERIPSGFTWTAELVLGEGRACVARLFEDEGGSDAADVRARDGALVGRVDTTEGERYPVRCTLEPPRRPPSGALD